MPDVEGQDGRLAADFTPPPAWWDDDERTYNDPPPADAPKPDESTFGDPWAEAEQQLANAAADAIDKVAEGVVLDDDTPPRPAEPEPVPPQLSPREQSARRLTAIAALEKLLGKLKAQEKDAGAWTGEGQKETVKLPTGEKLGHTRTDPVKGAWKVKDAGKWLAYVSHVAPDRLVEVTTESVDPTWQAQLLAALTAGKPASHPLAWVDLDTGEQVDAPPADSGLEYVPGGFKIVTVADPNAPAAVEKFLGPVAQQLGLPALEAEK